MTSQILFDRLAYVDRLKAGSFSEQQARAAADALGEALTEPVATKADVAQLETKMETRFSELETKMETRFSALDVRFANVDTRFAAIETRIAESRASLIQWIVGVAIAACTVGAAVASFIFKHMP
jgi:chromosome segregation ATPase